MINFVLFVFLVLVFQRFKFIFIIFVANKGNKLDMSKVKQDGNKFGEKGENIGMLVKLSSLIDVLFEIKFLIVFFDKRIEIVIQLEGL